MSIRRFAPRSLFSVALLVGAVGCHGAKAPASAPPQPNTVEALSDESFAESVYRVLLEAREGAAHSAAVVKVVRSQLVHAAALFGRGEDIRGARAVVGAFLLAGDDVANDLVLDASCAPALDGAIRRFSALGDEGRTSALLTLKRKVLAEGTQDARDVAAHIEALRTWQTETRDGATMQALGATSREALARALIDPSKENRNAARASTARWLERAIEINVAFQETRQLPERDDAVEAFRALQTGAFVTAALDLRLGRFNEALEGVEVGPAARIASPRFFTKLRAAAVEGRAEDVRTLARELAEMSSDADAGEARIDERLLHAALWGVGLEAYRRDPTSLAVAHLLANELVAHELPEVAPLVLERALGRSPSSPALNGAVELVGAALSAEELSTNTNTARRIYSSAKGLLELAETPEHLGNLRTSAATVRRLMAALELRAGNANEARAAMVAAARFEPTVGGLTALATLERQLGDVRAALASVDRAVHLLSDPIPNLEIADAHFVAFELARDVGNEASARASLAEALRIALEVRRLGGTSEVGLRAETLLARILDGYGEHERASSAMSRALDLADRHRPRLPETMLAAIARAVVQGDVGAARIALGMGIKAEIEQDSLVYGALWLGELERMQGEKPDGKVSRVFAEAVNGAGWTARLARWARSSISDAELSNLAKTHADRVEAAFYCALRARANHAADSTERIREVAKNPLIDLFEVRLARDILAPRLRLKLPSNTTLP